MVLIFSLGFLLGCLLALMLVWLYFSRRERNLADIKDQMQQAFKAISQDTVKNNLDLVNNSFKHSLEQLFNHHSQDRLATSEQLKSVIAPLKESLLAVDKKVGELESLRQGAYSGLTQQIEGLLHSQKILHKETSNLARALSAPTIRGRWGEMQLRRVVELSGMSQHCDFLEQASLKVDDELLRPDMIITLPKNKKIIIDAKAPLEVLLSGSEDNQANNQELLSTIKRHLIGLKKKNYHKIVGESPEFTIMFLPGESVLSRALLADPLLLDYAAQHEIILATPLTLIALLKAIAFSFKQESVANNIEEVRKLSQQLIDRVGVVASHFEKLGKHLKQATESYNQTLSSLDTRVLVTARKLSEIKSVNLDQDQPVLDLAYLNVMPRQTNGEQQ